MNTIKAQLCSLIMIMLSCAACGSQIIVEGFVVHPKSPQTGDLIASPTRSDQDTKRFDEAIRRITISAVGNSTTWQPSHQDRSVMIDRYHLHMPEVVGIPPLEVPALVQGHLIIEEAWAAHSIEDSYRLISQRHGS